MNNRLPNVYHPMPDPELNNNFPFQDVQKVFSAHIRNPQVNPKPQDIEERRMAIYRDLFYNNVAGFIENSFPVIYSLLPKKKWHRMVRCFFSEHTAHSPYFSDISKEFVNYLSESSPDILKDYPFLKELAHYEWVELALAILDENIDDIHCDDSNDFLSGIPVLSPLAWPLVYEYDVHHISANYCPKDKSELPIFIVVYRDRENDVEFLEINAMTFRMLQIIQENSKYTGQDVFEQILKELPQFNQKQIFDNGLNTLWQLNQRDIILGTKRS